MEAFRDVKDIMLVYWKTSWTIDDKVYGYTVYLRIDVRLNWLIIKCDTVYCRGPRY